MTILHRIASRGILPLFLVVMLAFGVRTAGAAATITIVNNDGAGEGFNDPTVVAPVGGNPGTTRGAQRLYIFQYAANIWGSILTSPVTILIRSQFDPQTCTATSAVLGSAGPVTIHRDFAGADFAGTWYHAALANKLSGTDLSAAQPDINATFNSQIDAACFAGSVWYYGTDGLEGVNIELLPVVLHEMGHGLGFSTTTSGTSGAYNSGFPSVFDRFLLDKATGLHWNQNTAANRVASAISLTGLVWDGASVTTGAASYLGPSPAVIVNAPAGIAGSYNAGTASFGPALTLGGVTGNVVLANDITAPVTDACEALTNAAAISGNVAFIDRGVCSFVLKAQAAQAAGAIALIIGNNAAGLAPGLGGSDPTITIPVVSVSQADANTIKANLGLGVNVKICLNPAIKAGADNLNHPYMYAPNPFQSGSSVSHWDTSLLPNALMEPAINNDLHDTVDLTLNAFHDIGWFPEATATTLALFTAEGRDNGILLRWQFNDMSDVGAVTIERATTQTGPWGPISTELGKEGSVTTALDMATEAGTTYFYRLSVMDRAGQTKAYGQVEGQRGSLSGGPLALSAPTPNPMSHGTSVTFRLSKPEYVRLVVTDASGRTVRSLQSGMMVAGQYVRTWDGLTEHSLQAPAGLYFISIVTGEGRKSQRVALVR